MRIKVKKLLTIMISLFILSLSFSLKSQVNRAGTIIKINGNEITVRNNNSSNPFVMGENLRLLTGDKSIVLQVTFAMQSSAKCKLISGKISSLKLGSLVYSGGIPENLIKKTTKTDVISNINSMKIDDFETFLGLTQGDTMDKAVQILGNPSETVSTDESGLSNDCYCWTKEDNCYISVVSKKSTKNNKEICCIVIFSIDNKNEYDIRKLIYLDTFIPFYFATTGKSFYLDTRKQGSVHYLNSKGLKDSGLNLFGISQKDIQKIFGYPKNIEVTNEAHHYWYKTLSKQDIVFSFNIDEDKLYSIIVYLK